ncbi:aminopeptidase [Erysipelotrichaceae bacterium 66-17]
MDEMKLKEYASLIAVHGLNVQKGQVVVINAPVEAKVLVREVARAAFGQCEAGDVIIRYKDLEVERERILHANRQAFEKVPAYESQFFNETAEKGACYLSITGADPDVMNGVDMKRSVEYAGRLRMATKYYQNKLERMESSWCVAACPTMGWAQKVYPELSGHEALERLWNAVFEACRVEPGKTRENWQEHNRSFEKHVELLNALDIEYLHYKNGAGTDLNVPLVHDYRFAGGSSTLRNEKGTVYFPNIPTEEVFSAPDKYGASGRLHATMPLIYNGSVIDDFWFEFRDGKVVDFDAGTGKEVLEALLGSDKNARYLGEVALVPVDSPISNMHTLFYNTLFDENASCHFALGTAYLECKEDGMELAGDQLDEAGLNESRIHVDFMVGSPDLRITAHCADGRDVEVFKDGNWTGLFC